MAHCLSEDTVQDSKGIMLFLESLDVSGVRECAFKDCGAALICVQLGGRRCLGRFRRAGGVLNWPFSE